MSETEDLNKLLLKAQQLNWSYRVDSPELLLPAFDHVISLGDRCTSGLAIRENNLNQTTHLFDWLIICGPKNLCACIEDNFQNFFYSSPNSPPVSPYGFVFAHHSNPGKYEENKIMMQRRISRLKALLESNTSILFVYSNEDRVYSANYRKRCQTYYDQMLNLVKIIKERYPALKFQILYIDSTERASTKDIISAYIPFPEAEFPIEIDLANRLIAEISGTLYVPYRRQCKEILANLPCQFSRYPSLIVNKNGES